MKLSRKQQLSIKQATHRLNIWWGAVRSSKTVASIIRWIQYTNVAPRGDLLMIGKTQRTVYRNVIRPMEDLLGNDVCYYPGKGELSLWGRKVFVVGANDERAEGTIRGMTAAGAYCDELTLYPESLFSMLLSRLSAPGAKLFGTTNTDSPFHWFKTGYLDRCSELDMVQWQFFLDDNPFLTRDYIENLKKEYVGLWHKRFIDALWVMAEGTVYDFFDEKVHLLRPQEVPDAKYYIVGCDYGTGNPTCFGLFGVDPDSKPSIWLEDEFYHDSRVPGNMQLTDSEYSVKMKTFLRGRIDRVRKIVLDPSAASFKTQLRRDGFFGIVDADNAVVDGIRTQSRLLKSREYSIKNTCKRTIGDYGGYAWDSKAQKRGEDKPLKGMYDHTKDMERYVLHTLFGKRTIDYTKLTRWS